MDELFAGVGSSAVVNNTVVDREIKAAGEISFLSTVCILNFFEKLSAGVLSTKPVASLIFTNKIIIVLFFEKGVKHLEKLIFWCIQNSE